MAKIERIISGDFDNLKDYIKKELPKESITFSLEEEFAGTANGKKYWIIACERYAALGANRTSLCMTMLEEEGGNHIMATGTGGSQGTFIKINTWSESEFLGTLDSVLNRYGYLNSGHSVKQTM